MDAFACVNARGGLVGVGSFFLFSSSKLSDMGLAQTTQTSTEGMVWSYDINVCTGMLMLNAKKHTNTFNILFLQAIDADQYLLICKLKACILLSPSHK